MTSIASCRQWLRVWHDIRIWPNHLQVQLELWTEVVQASMAALLEGTARIEKCTMEDRASMSMDIQVSEH